jgi:3-oxoadipate enol-lactonase
VVEERRPCRAMTTVRPVPSKGVATREITFRGEDDCKLFALAVGTGPPLVLLHGGGPDHQSLIPLAMALAGRATVILPDVRGYGRSICREPERHTWESYADDVLALLDHLGLERAHVGGAGMGSGIAVRVGLSWPARIAGLVLISPEHRGEERPSARMVARQEEMADRILTDGLEAAWEEWLPMMPEAMAAMVRDAFPRTDPRSQAAALRAIASQEPFESLEEIRALTMPTLVIPGGDPNHPPELGERYRALLARPIISTVDMWTGSTDAAGFATRVAPAIKHFLERAFRGPD